MKAWYTILFKYMYDQPSFFHKLKTNTNRISLDIFKNTKEKSQFEFVEDLEINRFLELDIPVKCIELAYGGKAVDTEKDLKEVSKIIKENPNY